MTPGAQSCATSVTTEAGLRLLVDIDGRRPGEVVSALEWAEIRALRAGWGVAAGDREAVGDQSATVPRALVLEQATEVCAGARGVAAGSAYRGDPAGIEAAAEIKAPRPTELLRDEHGYAGSVDLVRRRLAGLRPRVAWPAQRAGYRPGRWCSLLRMRCRRVSRSRVVERQLYPLIASLPFAKAQSAHFSLT